MQHDKQQIGADSLRFSEHELVFMMGEELKKPLTAIKVLAEASEEGRIIQLEASRALRTIDNVLLYQRLAADQLQLDLSPVHLGSTLADVAEHLRPLSMEFGCETEVHIQSGVATVDADRRVLRSGIESLWQAMLGMTQRPSPLSWQVYRMGKGVRIVLLSNSVDLGKVSFSNITQAGRTRQPFSGVAGPATDLVTARCLFDSLGARLTKIHKDGQEGFGVTLPASPQLTFV